METKDFVNKRTGLGAATLGLVGFLFGGPAGAGVGALLGAALANLGKPTRKGEMSPERRTLYETAMQTTSDPAELREMADSYESEGLVAEATMLRKRAELREMPAGVRDQRRRAYRQMTCSDDVDGIMEMAGVFAAEGALGSATGLRQHAADVRAAHEAGKSAKPLPDPKVIALFGNKLAQAIYHFKPTSREARTAAANFLRARGMAPTEELVMQAITAAVEEMRIPDQAPASAPAEQAEEAEAAPPSEEEASEEEAAPVAASEMEAPEDVEVREGEEPVGSAGQEEVAPESAPNG